jgi:hypothetical protein
MARESDEQRRYQSYHFPWYNLGRAYAAKELFSVRRSASSRPW